MRPDDPIVNEIADIIDDEKELLRSENERLTRELRSERVRLDQLLRIVNNLSERSCRG